MRDVSYRLLGGGLLTAGAGLGALGLALMVAPERLVALFRQMIPQFP
jgi:hypothetical protein